MKRFLAFILFIHPCLNVLQAQVSMPNALSAIPVASKMEVDGFLNEEAWKKAPRISNFTQRELTEGAPASERTEVAVLFDQNTLYIGVWCFDKEPGKLISKELKRDFDYSLDDNFIVIIDPYNDKRNGYMFVTNPVAARADLMVFNNGGSSNAFWNGVWDVHTQITDSGWFAEFEIPFYTLKYRTQVEEQIWGINFERNIRRKREQVRWQGWSRNNSIEQVNQAGTLQGLGKLDDMRFLELKPYALGGAERIRNVNSGTWNAGADFNYLLSPTYRLNVTVNPDFAQVESDQQQVNLTRFPLFFPELREFFLEGTDYFDFGFGGNRIVPFYTRRIGLDQRREAVPIIGGARLLGKEENRTLGLMSLQTAAIPDQASTNYSTLSWRQDLGRQSIAGAMSTNTFSQGRWHSTTGVNGRFSTAKLFGNKNFDLGGAFIKTHNNEDGWQRDAYAYRAFVSYPNDKFNIFGSTQRSPAGFEPEVGLMRRRNFREHFLNLGYRPRPAADGRLKWIRQFDFIPAQITYTLYNDTREIQSFEYLMRFFGFSTRSGESIGLNYRRLAEGLIEPFNIYPGVVIDSGTYWWNQYQLDFSTFRGRTLAISGNLNTGQFYDGNSLQVNTQIWWRLNRHFNLQLAYTHNDVRLPSGNFRNELLNARAEYALNPNTFGSLLAQWNTAEEILNFNFRLRVIPRIGTDFFLIVNQLYHTDGRQPEHRRTTVLGKLIWRFML